MSYLRRVLARTAGRPLGPLQVAQPRRWSSQAADPFAAADQAAATPATAAANSPRAGVLDDGGEPRSARGSRVRRGVDPSVPSAAPLLAPPVGLRGARPAMLEHRESSDGAEPRARIPAVTGHEPDAAPRPSVTALPSAQVASPATPGLMSRPASVASERRAEPSAVLMPPPLVPRREPAAATDPVRPRRDAPAAGADPRRPTVVVAAPPAEHAASPRPSAASRPEIVIGRISVVVESVRPTAAATRTVVRHVTATPRNADESSGLSHRFGLGQL